jgi:hypothetical protein
MPAPLGGDGPFAGLREGVARLRVQRFRFSLQTLQEVVLPQYKGSTFRGAFGESFLHLACGQRELQAKQGCHGCLLNENCPYAIVFETSAPADAEQLKLYEAVPRPFVLEPPETTQATFPQGSTLDVGVVLIGRAIDLLPYFVVVFREMGRQGVGRGRGRLELASVWAREGCGETLVFSGRNGEVHIPKAPAATAGSALDIPSLATVADTLAQAIRDTADPTLEVTYHTQTRIKFDDSFRAIPEFHILVRNTLRRLSSLLYFHHGQALELDFRGIIEAAGRIALVDHDIKWVDWERYSSRQETRMKLGGIVGTARYRAADGDTSTLASFAPLLAAAEWLHIGKAVTFGMGRVSMKVVGKPCGPSQIADQDRAADLLGLLLAAPGRRMRLHGQDGR